MNCFDGKTSFKVLTLYLRDQTYQFHNVSNCKTIETNNGEDYSFPEYHLSFDYVSQTTGRSNHGYFDCDCLVGVSYEE